MALNEEGKDTGFIKDITNTLDLFKVIKYYQNIIIL